MPAVAVVALFDEKSVDRFGRLLRVLTSSVVNVCVYFGIRLVVVDHWPDNKAEAVISVWVLLNIVLTSPVLTSHDWLCKQE